MNKTASIEWLDFNELLLGMYSLWLLVLFADD
jgi:hypothetical protein